MIYPHPGHQKLIEAIPVILGEMERLPVLMLWHMQKEQGNIQVPNSCISLFDDACMDSMLLTIRTLDEFFRLRLNAPKRHEFLKTALVDDLYAEQFGFKEEAPLLSKQRRDELNKHLCHLTWHRTKTCLRTAIRDDVFQAIGPCSRFLGSIVNSGLLQQAPDLLHKVCELREKMLDALEDPHWATQ